MRRSNASSSSSDVHVSPRIVSLVPSSTETLLSLGAPVTACTRFCEQPGIPHVGGTKNPDIERIIELAPDFVVMDREENRRRGRRHVDRGGHRALRLGCDDGRRGRTGRDRPGRSGGPTAAGLGGAAVDGFGGRDRIRAHLASTVDVDQPVDLRRRPARPARHRARHRRTPPTYPHGRPRRRRRPATDCGARAERAVRVPGSSTSTNCAAARSVRGRAGRRASTDRTCSGGAAGPRAPSPASAPNSPAHPVTCCVVPDPTRQVFEFGRRRVACNTRPHGTHHAAERHRDRIRHVRLTLRPGPAARHWIHRRR